MNYPLISEYIEAIKAAGNNFKKLNSLRTVLDDVGEPVMSNGDFAVVFKMKDEQTGKLYAVKCFLKDQKGRAEAYRMIAEELEYVSSTFFTSIKYLDKELFVDTNNSDESEFPVLLMDWVEGQTLDKYIREHIDDQYELSLLAYQFSRLAMWLMPQPFAHGDLKPDNILVKDDGTLVLVDYDGMYVQAMKSQKARELGSPDFRHPLRTEDDFDEHIDDFSLASILLSLKAIALQPDLLEEYGASDRLLFSEKDYRNLSESSVLGALQPLMQDAELASLYSLYILALSQNNLSQVSFRLFNLSRPQVPIPKDINGYWWYIKRTGVWTDEYGVKYSADKKFLISAPNVIKEYAVPKGTKYIASNAFINCRELCSISLPNTLEVISNIAFFYCVKLSSVTIPKSVKEVGLGAFEGCFSLTTIVVDKGNLFYDSRNNCNAIIETLSNTLIVGCSTTVIPPSTTKIGKSAFSHCKTLKSIILPDSILEIDDYAFSECYYLEKIIIPQSVITIGCGVFQNCQNLSSLIVENENIQYDSRNNCNAIIESQSDTLVMGTPVTSIPNSIVKIGKNSFKWCQGLNTITIPNGIIEIEDGAFESCQYLSEIKISDSVIKIGKGVFSDCRKLETVIIPYGKRSKFEQLLLEYKDKLVELDEEENLSTEVTDEDLANAWVDEFGVYYTEDYSKLLGVRDKSLKDYHIKEGTIIICDWAFRGCSELVSITIPESVRCIGYRAFFECYSIEHLRIPKSVKTIKNAAFQDVVSLKTIILPSSIHTIGTELFAGCSSLVSIDIPESVVCIGDYAFSGCSSLSIVTIPKSVVAISDNAFSGCKCNFVCYSKNYKSNGMDLFTGDMKTLIHCSTSIIKYTIPDSVITIGSNAFAECISLSSIIIPNTVTSIKEWAFLACENLKTIDLPQSLIDIGECAFGGCSLLKTIIIPQNVTSIGKNAFEDCSSLTTVRFVKEVFSIGTYIFQFCPALKTIIIPIGKRAKFEEMLPEYKDKLVEKSNVVSITFDNSSTSKVDRCRVFKKDNDWKLEIVYKNGMKIASPHSLLQGNQSIVFDKQTIEKIQLYVGYCEGFYVNPKAVKVDFEYPAKYTAKILFDSDYIEINGITWGQNNNINEWKVKGIRSFNIEERLAVQRAEVVSSDYGCSVCFFMNGGGQTYIPLSKQSKLKVGDELDIKTAKFVTLGREGKDDIFRVME